MSTGHPVVPIAYLSNDGPEYVGHFVSFDLKTNHQVVAMAQASQKDCKGGLFQQTGYGGGRQMIVKRDTSASVGGVSYPTSGGWVTLDGSGASPVLGTRVDFPNGGFPIYAQPATTGAFEWRNKGIPFSEALYLVPWGGAAEVVNQQKPPDVLLRVPNGDAIFSYEPASEVLPVEGWSLAGGRVSNLLRPEKGTVDQEVATDGIDIVWRRVSSDPASTSWEFMTAPYSLDPDKIQGGLRKVGGTPASGDGVVGCGSTAYRASENGVSFVEILRLSDNSRWRLLDPSKKIKRYPLFLDCDDLYARRVEASSMGEKAELVKFRLDSLGPLTVPN